MAAEIAFWAAAALAILGAGWDVRTRRIPNWLVLALAAVAAGATFASGGFGLLGSSALHALIALLVGMALFAVRAIGAGDAKFYAAAALAVPLDRALAMLGWVALSGLVVVIILMVVYRGLRMVKDGKKVSWTLPYGLPICCGFLGASLLPFDRLFP
ncbi:MAG: prepilin peptidase [Erythrobacter sp.]